MLCDYFVHDDSFAKRFCSETESAFNPFQHERAAAEKSQIEKRQQQTSSDAFRSTPVDAAKGGAPESEEERYNREEARQRYLEEKERNGTATKAESAECFGMKTWPHNARAQEVYRKVRGNVATDEENAEFIAWVAWKEPSMARARELEIKNQLRTLTFAENKELQIYCEFHDRPPLLDAALREFKGEKLSPEEKAALDAARKADNPPPQKDTPADMPDAKPSTPSKAEGKTQTDQTTPDEKTANPTDQKQAGGNSDASGDQAPARAPRAPGSGSGSGQKSADHTAAPPAGNADSSSGNKSKDKGNTNTGTNPNTNPSTGDTSVTHKDRGPILYPRPVVQHVYAPRPIKRI